MRNEFDGLSDADLLAALKILAAQERRRAVELLKHLAEADRRRAAVVGGFPSLFEYCVKELRFTHAETARRIQAARAAAEHRLIYRYIARGVLSITSVSLLAPHLNAGNRRVLLRAASGKSTREVEALVAGFSSPQKSVERVRFVRAVPPVEDSRPSEKVFEISPNAPEPEARSEPRLTAPRDAPAAQPEPIPEARSAKQIVTPAPAERRVVITFSAPEAFWGNVERLRELTRSRWPGGCLEDLLPGAVDELLDKLDPERCAARRGLPARPPHAAESRRPSAAARAIVWKRDSGRCSYRSADGRVCGTRSGLEVDHIRPWARGGRSDDIANLRLLCRAHNQIEARRVFGDGLIDAAIGGRKSHSAGT